MINLSDEHAEALRELLEIVLADEDNSMGVTDGRSPDDVAEIRAQWQAAYDAVCHRTMYAAGVRVELLGEDGKVWVRAVTAGRAAPDSEPLVYLLRPDGTTSAAAVGWPAQCMRLEK